MYCDLILIHSSSAAPYNAYTHIHNNSQVIIFMVARVMTNYLSNITGLTIIRIQFQMMRNKLTSISYNQTAIISIQTIDKIIGASCCDLLILSLDRYDVKIYFIRFSGFEMRQPIKAVHCLPSLRFLLNQKCS